MWLLDVYENEEDEPTRKLAETLESMLAKSPLKAMNRCRREYRSEEEGHVKLIRLLILCGYCFALEAKRDPDLMEDFLQEKLFDECKQTPKPDNILRLSMGYLVGAVRGPGPKYERACNYAVALERYFKREASAENVALALNEHGIEWLYRAAVEERKAEKGNEDPDHSRNESDDEDDDPSTSDEEDLDTERNGESGSEKRSEPPKEAGQQPVAAKHASAGGAKKGVKQNTRSSRSKQHYARFNPDNSLVVEMSPEELDRVLGLGVNDRAMIRIKRAQHQGKWVKVVATDVTVH